MWPEGGGVYFRERRVVGTIVLEGLKEEESLSLKYID
jgi:hypothetical protein